MNDPQYQNKDPHKNDSFHRTASPESDNIPTAQTTDSGKANENNSPSIQQLKAFQAMADNSPRVQQLKAYQEMADNSPRAQQFKAYQEMADNSPRMQQFKAYQEMVDNSPRVQQFKAFQAMADNYTTNTIQRKGYFGKDENIQKDEKESGGLSAGLSAIMKIEDTNIIAYNESPVNNPSTSGTENKKDKNSNTANITDFVSPERLKHFQESVKTNSTSSPQTRLNVANPATQMGTDLKASVQVNKKTPLASPRAVNTEKASFHVSNKSTSANPTGNTEKTDTSIEKFKIWLGIITYGQHNKGEDNVTAEHTTWIESALLEMLELFTSNPEFSNIDSRTEAIKKAVEAVNKALEQAGKEGYIKYDYSDKPGEETDTIIITNDLTEKVTKFKIIKNGDTSEVQEIPLPSN